MHFSTLFLVLPTLFVILNALPSSSTSHEDRARAILKYHIKTVLKKGQTKAAFDGLYLESFHVAAGMNVATFQKDSNTAPVAFLNGTRLQFEFEGSPYPGYLGLEYPESDFYAGWFSTSIDMSNLGTEGFTFDRDGHLVNNNDDLVGFGGWLVCSWNHDSVPELFHEIVGGFKNRIPGSCARVHLVREFV